MKRIFIFFLVLTMVFGNAMAEQNGTDPWSRIKEMQNEALSSLETNRKADEENMANIDKINFGGTDYNIKDVEAREAISQLTEEMAKKDLPIVFYGGALPQTKDDAIMSFDFVSESGIMKLYCETKAQGTSSMRHPKKNQTTKFYADAACTEKLKINFRNWGAQNKFCLKANWIDLTHARNIVSARIWGDVVRSRKNFAELPELLRTSPNVGAIDGFPVLLYANGVYMGRYTLNIPKDGWMTNMDDENPNHCILCGENYESGCFRAAAKIDESDWSDELHKVVPENIKTRWNEVISFVMNSSDDEFKANLGNYFYVDSLIDYLLYALASCGLDSMGKNQIYMTYDGQKWIASMYDMDSTWGLYYDGSKLVPTGYGRTSYEDYVNDRQGNLLYIRLEQNFSKEIQARWAELKTGALSYSNIMAHFERFVGIVPSNVVEEDYASTTGGGAFTNIPSKTENTIQQIRAYALARQKWTDGYVANLNNEYEGSILYQLAEPTTFNGTSDYIDTGIKLAETDIDFTIAFHATPMDTETVEQTIYHCMHEAPPYPGYVFGRNMNADWYWQTSYSANYNIVDIRNDQTSPFKVVITHAAGSGMVTVKTLNNGSVSDGTENSKQFTWATVPDTLVIGAYQTTNGTKGRFWKGTMHEFVVCDDVWSNEMINAYLT